MRKRKIVLLSSIAVSLSSIVLFAINQKGNLFASNADACSHVGYHYGAKAPTATASGWQEYWICCKCHEAFLTMPSGSFTDQAASLMVGGEPDSSHIAYLPAGAIMAPYTSTVVKDHDKDFKILTLTDIQLHDGQPCDADLAILDETFNAANPDMVVFLGDLLNDHNIYKSVVNYARVIEKIDSWGVPWAPIFGNHDYEDYQTAYQSQKTTTHFDLINAFKSASNCIFKEGPESVTGSSNYMINIVDDETNKPVQSLIMLDSRLAGVSDTHGQFYKDCSNYAKTLNDGNYVETIVCTHVPLPEYGEAYEYMQSVDYSNVTGTVGRNPCDLATGSHTVFSAIQEYGNCHNVICGHDHENAYWTMQDGVRLAYSMKSSYGDGHNNPAVLGGAMFTVSSGMADLEYVHAKEGYVIDNDLAVIIEHLPHWRYSGAKLKFDIEFLSETNSGIGKMSLMGTNILRYSVAENEQVGMWNRLTGRVDFNGNRTTDIGSLSLIEGNKYEYTMDVTDIPLNTAGGEVANGEETLRMLYFNNFSSTNKVKVSNFRYEFENITETDQYDLANATISSISDQFYNFGQFVRPAVTVKAGSTTLKAIDDILVTYSNNRQIGQASLTVQPSGKGAHRYKGSKTVTFNIVTNPDADTVPGHENAKLVDTSVGYENEKDFVLLNDWYNSGKSLYFEAKRLQNGAAKSGETFKFSLLGKNSNPGHREPETSNWNRLTAMYTVDLSTHTVKNGSGPAIGTVTDLGDNWYSYSIPLNAFILNSEEGAMGNANETLALIYIDNVTRSFKLDNLSVK